MYTIDRFPWGLEAKPNTLPEAVASLAWPLRLVGLLGAELNMIALLGFVQELSKHL